MKTFNYYIQLGIVISVILIFLAAIVENGMLLFLLYVQFGVGVYQFLVGAYFAYIDALAGQFKRYFYFALANLTSISLFAIIEPEDFSRVFSLLVFVLPWTLAVYFFFLSYRYYQQS